MTEQIKRKQGGQLGHKSWNKGKCMPEEFKKKISNTLKGRIPKNINLLKSKAHKFRNGEFHPKWKGGLHNYHRRIARKLVENFIGRKLNYDEVVHHIDRDYTNNNISNLLIMSRSGHARFHRIKFNRRLK